MNPISDKVKVGTVGELLVQLRLLQYGVQAAAPLKDSGNDLIAVNGSAFRAISIRTTTGETFNKPSRARRYDILAVVQLVGEDFEVYLDQSPIYLIPRDQVKVLAGSLRAVQEHLLTHELVARLFSNQ